MKIPVEFNSLAPLPVGWSWQPLQSLTANPKQDVVDGPFGSDLKASEYVSHGVPIARLQNIDRNNFVTKNIRFLTTEKAADLARHEFRPDDILITKLGDPLGKACIVPRSIGHGVIVADLVRVRPDERLVDRRYLTYAINSPSTVKQFELHTKGTTRPRVNLSVLRQLPIPVAPRHQQEEIVDAIERQFSRLDEAVANLQRVKANLKRYKASVLQAAVEGRVVPTEAELARREGRSYESGERLLERILAARRDQWVGRGKYKAPEAPRREWTFDLPEGWAWSTLGHLAVSVKDGPHFSPKYAAEGIPFISGGNIRPEGIDFSATKFITPELHAELSKRCRPLRGDLLYTKGGTTGIARVNTDTRDFNVWVHVAVLKLSQSIEPFFVQHALNSQHCYRQAQEYTHGVGNQDLGLTRMVWITIPLPPLSEQRRIVAEVDRRLSILREVESEVDTNLKRANSLRQAALARAFTVQKESTRYEIPPS